MKSTMKDKTYQDLLASNINKNYLSTSMNYSYLSIIPIMEHNLFTYSQNDMCSAVDNPFFLCFSIYLVHKCISYAHVFTCYTQSKYLCNHMFYHIVIKEKCEIFTYPHNLLLLLYFISKRNY